MLHENSLISIIVPIFNVEAYIAECIESIQGQKYRNLQIILVDDGSTDQSGILCDKYAQKDSRIEVIHQQNKGLVAARKSGLKKARGKYIGFVDGDDYIESEMYLMLMQEIQISGADFVHSGFWEDSLKKVLFSKEMINLSADRNVFLENVLLGKENGITPSIWSKLFKADLIKKSYEQLDDSSSFGEDLLALCVCILEGRSLSVVESCQYHYRVREGSISHRNDIGDLKRIYKLHEDLSSIFHFYGLYKDFEAIMDKFLWRNLVNYMSRVNRDNFQIAKYYFKNVGKLYNKKIVIYGAGMVGCDYYAQICRYSDCEVAAWVDAHPERYQYKHINVYEPDILDSIEFDILLIAVLKKTMADDIRNQLTERGVSKEKIYWSKPERWGFNGCLAD